MADCEQTLHELERFLDGELDDGLKQAILEHASGCNPCMATLDFHAELQQVVREKARNDQMPADLRDKLEACLGGFDPPT